MKKFVNIVSLLFILSLSEIQSLNMKRVKREFPQDLAKISTRTLLSLFHADPDQLSIYHDVIFSNIYDLFDMDLRKTKDGVWVNLNKDTFEGMKLKDNTYDEICKKAKDKCPFKFEDLLDLAVKSHAYILFEDKSSETDNLPELAKIVQKHKAEDYVFVSKNSYKLLTEALKSFKNVMIYDVWGPNCTPEQAEELLEMAKKKGGKVMLNTSINMNKYLSPDEVKKWALKGFLVEVGFNGTKGKKEDYLDFFKKYDIRFVNAIKINGLTYDDYSAAFREVYA